jgi:hypothetical protein
MLSWDLHLQSLRPDKLTTRMTIYKALFAGVSIVFGEVVLTAVYPIVHVAIVRRSTNVAYGLFAAAAITIGSPLYWILLVVLASGISWLFIRHC